MMRQAENRVKIEGLLSEIDLRDISYNKNGKETEAIAGSITIKVKQTISGQEKELSIPVHMFATKYTNKGTPNPAYESIADVKNNYVSIAAAGEEGADCVRITNASIRMNEFYGQNGNLVSYPRVNASFVNKIKREMLSMEATFITEFVVASMSEEIGPDGEETGRTLVKAILPQYGGKVDVVPFYAESDGVIDAINNYWEQNTTVRANGRLDFSYQVQTFERDGGFGEPITETRTISKSDLIITGGSQEPLDEEFAFAHDDIQAALTERKTRLEALKEKDANKTPKATTPDNGFKDFGF